jgi:hypothetical protein
MSATIVDPGAYEARNGFPMQPVRCHHLKALGKAPAYAHLALSEVEDEDDDESAAISLGKTVHAIIQGRKDILVYRGKVRRGKEWDEFRAQYPTARIVLDKEMKAAESMAASLLADKDACQYIKARGVKREKTMLFDYLGRECRSTPDLAAANGSWVADLKTTRCSKPSLFVHDARRLSYHVQLAMQGEAIRAKRGAYPEEHIIIAVESSGKFLTTVMRVDEESLLEGRKLMRLWMEQLLACEASGSWPGYAESIVLLSIAAPPLELTYAEEPPADEATT